MSLEVLGQVTKSMEKSQNTNIWKIKIKRYMILTLQCDYHYFHYLYYYQPCCDYYGYTCWADVLKKAKSKILKLRLKNLA